MSKQSDGPQIQKHFQWKEAVAGAVSGALTVLLLHPLDVVKTRLQVQEAGSHRYHGTVHAVRLIAKREGVRGLYAGAPRSVARASSTIAPSPPWLPVIAHTPTVSQPEHTSGCNFLSPLCSPSSKLMT